MPELPDVAGFRRCLDSTGLHQTIVRATVTDQRILRDLTPQALGRRLKGAHLDQTHRHGKLLFARTSRSGWLVLHFGMSGQLRYYGRSAHRPDYARVILDFSNGRHLAYVSLRMLGMVGFTEDTQEFIREQGLGPDALSDGLDEQSFVHALAGRHRMLKPALVDQSVVAGIGNLWADEILFQTRVHPTTQASALSEAKLREIYRAMRRVLRVGVARQAPPSHPPGMGGLPVVLRPPPSCAPPAVAGGDPRNGAGTRVLPGSSLPRPNGAASLRLPTARAAGDPGRGLGAAQAPSFAGPRQRHVLTGAAERRRGLKAWAPGRPEGPPQRQPYAPPSEARGFGGGTPPERRRNRRGTSPRQTAWQKRARGKPLGYTFYKGGTVTKSFILEFRCGAASAQVAR